MYVPLRTFAGDNEYAQSIGLHCFDLMALTPVNIGTTGLASTIDDMCGFDVVEDSPDLRLFLHRCHGAVHCFALLSQESDDHLADPAAVAAPDEENGSLSGRGHGGWL
jgi:hypothetical protein